MLYYVEYRGFLNNNNLWNKGNLWIDIGRTLAMANELKAGGVAADLTGDCNDDDAAEDKPPGIGLSA